MPRALPTPIRSGCRHFVGLAVVVLLTASCGGADRSATTTFTVPPVTTPRVTTTSTSTATAPTPRADLAGLSAGVGLGSLTTSDLEIELDAVAATRVRWLRLDFDWSVIQDGGPSAFDWSDTDRIVDAASLRNLSIIALVTYTPSWARPPGSPDKNPPTDPDDFARFVSVAAQRYPQVTTWEIWNEPNVAAFWYPRPDPEGYTALLVRASAAIHAVDSNATIISGGLAPASNTANGSQIDARTFLARVYDARGGRAFDAVGLHPYSFPHLPMYAADYNTFVTTPGLYQVMVDHGDVAKKIWGTEVGAPTEGGGGSVTESRQAEIAQHAYQRWTTWRFTGPLIWFEFQDAGSDPDNRDDHFGLVAADGREKPALAVFRDIVRALVARQPPAGESTPVQP